MTQYPARVLTLGAEGMHERGSEGMGIVGGSE